MESGANAALRHANAPESPLIEVVAGLIFREGQLLIAQRHPETHLGGLWEFPGGKREEGETFEAALIRELQEELDVTVSVGELIDAVEHTYADRTVRIRFFRCRIREGEPRALGCQAFKWIQRAELHAQHFPEADSRLLDRLALEDGIWAAASGD